MVRLLPGLILVTLLAGCASTPPRASTTDQQVWSFVSGSNDALAIPAEFIIDDPELFIETGPIARSPAPGQPIMLNAFAKSDVLKNGMVRVLWLDEDGAWIGGQLFPRSIEPGGVRWELAAERAAVGTARVRIQWETLTPGHPMMRDTGTKAD